MNDDFSPDTRHWQGRKGELTQLKTWLSEPSVQLIGIKAAGGFGKSALVEKIREQLFADQACCFEKGLALTFGQAYAFSLWGRWLMAHFGERVEDSVSDTALARLAVARLRAQKCLLILDNVETLLTAEGREWKDAGYGAFLLDWLSGPGESVVVMTSREEPDVPDNLTLYCRWYDLGGLATQAGVDLLRELGVLGDEKDLQEFADKAGGHPLLLKLAAGWLRVEEPDEPKIEYLKNLGGVDLFEYVGAHRGQPETSVKRILQATLDRLPAQMGELLPALSLYRLPFTLAAAQAMGSASVTEADLRQLTKRALLQEKKQSVRGERLRCFEFQPLVQRYLQSQANQEDHRKAIDHYKGVCKPALEATDELAATSEYQEIFHHYCELGEYAQALEAIRTQTDENDRYSSCDMVLQLRGYNAIRLTLYERIVQLWQPQDDSEARLRGDALQAQGDVLQFLDRRDEAIENYDEALAIYRQVGDRLGEANTLQAQGDVLQFLKRSSEAIENYDEALAIYRQVGARLGEANTLQAQGDVLQFLKRSSEAIENYDEALAIYRQVGDRLGEANTLKAQGDVLQFLKRSSEAIENYDEALAIYRQVGDRLGEANTLKAQGDVLQFLDRRDEAIENYDEALAIYRQVGDRLGEANTLQAQGDVLQFLKRSSEAIENYDEALAIYRQVGARLGEANTLKAQGDVLQFLKRSSEAIENYDEALAIYRQVGDRLGEANTLKAQGDVLQFLKRSSEAIENYDEALAIYRQVGDRLGEANTLKAQGLAQEKAQQGIDYLQSAQTLYEQIGDVYSQGVNLFYLGGLQAQLEQNDTAIASFQRAITLGKQIGFDPLVEYASKAIQDLLAEDQP